MTSIPRVILDTNVFVSGIFWSGPPRVILRAWQEKAIELVLSIEIFDEYKRVFEILTKKYPPVDLSPFIEIVAREARFFEPIILDESVSSDPDDDKFIACALAAEVDYIVSGDKDLLTVNNYQGLKIIKPSAFVKMYLA